MNYVTYSDLFAYTMVIIALLALIIKDKKRKQQITRCASKPCCHE